MPTNPADEVSFQARLEDCVARTPARDIPAPYAVNEAMIGMWADALMDDNPVYVDAAAARETGRPGIIAPPTMIQAWIMPKLSRVARGASDVPGFAPYIRQTVASAPPADKPHEIYFILAERGYVNSAATNCRQVYHRESQPGDHLRCLNRVESVSPLKRTAMGLGHFVTTRLDFSDQQDRPVATHQWSVLRFRKPTETELEEGRKRRGSAPQTSATATATATATARATGGGPLEGAPREGQRTAETVIAITPTFVVATAFATHDFYAVHHDVDWARSIGQRDIFSNILTTTGLVGGVMTQWGGPSVRLRSVDLRLFTPNYPGDELRLNGVVSAVAGETVTMAVTGVNRLGTHVEAVVVGDVPGVV